MPRRTQGKQVVVYSPGMSASSSVSAPPLDSHSQIHRGQIVDLLQQRIFPGEVFVKDGQISAIREVSQVDETDGFLMPGFVDSHIHIESSLLTPPEFARLAVAHGTVAAVCDPHEIANVMGIAGVRYMQAESERTPFHFFFGVPSCVPATIFETSGATLGLAEVRELLSDPRFTHLSEVMNVPGVLHGDPVLLGKLAAAQDRQIPIDGHAPGLFGEALREYVRHGISTDHECTSLEEARQKLWLGQKIQIREGSAAKNFSTLWPLLKEAPRSCMLCSDDLHPDDLVIGHISRLAAAAIQSGVDLFSVLHAACRTPVLHYRLPVGQLQVGDRADFVRVRDLKSLEVVETWLQGELVFHRGACLLPRLPIPICNHFSAQPIEKESLRVCARAGKLRVIVAHDRQLLTDCEILSPKVVDGAVVSDPDRDVLKLVVQSRYNKEPPQVAFVRGFGLVEGAIATSVAHDSHNVIAVGADDDALLLAINRVLAERGGLCVVSKNETRCLPLPIAGLMSDADGREVAAQYVLLNQLAAACGCPLAAPLMTLSFLALLVIPSLKLSDRGLFDGNKFQFVDLFVETDVPHTS